MFLVQTVILDANSLMMPFQFKINIDLELQRLLGDCKTMVPSAVLDELWDTSEPQARAARKLAAKYPEAPSSGAGDDAILECAVKLNAVLVTNDKELCARAKSEGLRVATLKGRNHLVIEEF